MTQQKSTIHKDLPSILRYGLAIGSVALALGLPLLLERYNFRGVEFPLFLFAIAVTVWYAGLWPGVLAVVLSSLAFNYFFTEPIYTLYVSRLDLPYYVVFILFASLLAWFSTIRRRVEQELRQSRDELEKEVAERTQQASLLNLTHDTIFVRDMSDIITYWNRGAEELYGWSPQQAVGQDGQQLLHAEFPTPLADLLTAMAQELADSQQTNCANKFKIPRWASRGAGYDMNMLDGTIRQEQAIFVFKIFPILRRAIDYLFHDGRVLRMNPLKNQAHVRLYRPIEFKASAYLAYPR
jgi:PAS domain S-box-containing protein